MKHRATWRAALILLLLAVSARASAQQISKDSLRLLPYAHAADVAALFPGVLVHELGIAGHPLWPSYAGSLPWQVAVVHNDRPVCDMVTGAAQPLLLPVEDARSFRLLPQHAAFIDGSGMLCAFEAMDSVRHDAEPMTRVRHTEGPYSLMFTDVMFSVRPFERSAFQAAITRRTVGTTGTGNSARFRNMLAESWNLRLHVRQALGERTSLHIWDVYDDLVAFENGGIQGLPDGEGRGTLYPSSGDYEASAFDPILATAVNPTFCTLLLRNDLNAELAHDWADSTQHSAIRFITTTSSRTVSDALDENQPDSLKRSRLDARHAWQAVGARVSQRGTLAALRIAADAELLSAPVTDPLVAEPAETLVAMARLSAELTVGPALLTVSARSDRRWGDGGTGLGASAGLPLGEALRIRAGISSSTRPYTPFERFAAGERIQRIGAFPDVHERHVVADGGLQLASGIGDVDLQLFYRTTRAPLRMSIGLAPDSLQTGQTRFTTVFETVDAQQTVAGATLAHSASLRWLRLDTRVAVAAAPAGSPSLMDLMIPAWEVSCTPSFRGELISGTLALRAGCTVTARGRYRPPAYNPETGLFGRSLYDASAYTGGVTADLFLFATIKDAATIHLLLRNAFDVRTVTTLFYPMADRGFHFGVDWMLFD